MKKLIQVIVFTFIGYQVGYCQLNELGYKDLKLGMPLSEAKKIVKIDGLPEDNSHVDVKYDGIGLYLYFDDNILTGIGTDDKNAKLDGVSANVIGKTIKEVKALLGPKMVLYEDNVYLYYRNKAAEQNDATECQLYFHSGTGRLEGISNRYSFNAGGYSDLD